MTELVQAADELRKALSPLNFAAPVSHTYNPLDYAWETHRAYLERFGTGRKRVVFLGMNPGPWGMAQTGVPFGEIAAVRDWMGLSGKVDKPSLEHPKRPITGFDCTRSEVSGRRLWGLFAEHFGTAENFFRDHFVCNFCPLVWMSETGRNITPDKLPKNEIAAVDVACLRHLSQSLAILQPKLVVGVGAFAQNKLKEACKSLPNPSPQIGSIIHPSPASPIANREWPKRPLAQLRTLGVLAD